MSKKTSLEIVITDFIYDCSKCDDQDCPYRRFYNHKVYIYIFPQFFHDVFRNGFQHGIPEKFAPANVTNKSCTVKMLIQMSRDFDVLTNSGNPGAKITFHDIIIMNI